MRALIIANCTNRKRATRAKPTYVRALSAGPVATVATAWIDALSHDLELRPLTTVYCGRGFSEVLGAAKTLKATLLVVSAGLGLVAADTAIPSYGATISGASDDNVLGKLDDGDPVSWWQKICELSPFSTPLATGSYDLVLIALSRPYFPLIAPALESLDAIERAKIRLFLSASANELREPLRDYLMPYGSNFDNEAGPLPGTKSDFTQRALRHFVNTIVDNNAHHESATLHRIRIERELAALSTPVRPVRQRMDDRQIAVLIRRHWHDVRGGSSRMLRYLRDTLGVACEQKRFQGIFNQIREMTK